jgi:hypothetical protein
MIAEVHRKKTVREIEFRPIQSLYYEANKGKILMFCLLYTKFNVLGEDLNFEWLEWCPSKVTVS